jgi:DNA-binding CsgD family transcriptional regulator
MAERTEGVLSRSRIHREVGRVFGFMGDELRVAFLAGPSAWGVAALARRRPDPHFSQADVSFIASVSREVGQGLRAAVLLEALAEPGPADAMPGLVLLTATDELAAITPQAQAWLDELVRDYGLRPGDRAPAALLAVAARAREAPSGAEPPTPARARVRTRSGRWLVLHGAVLQAAGAPQTAVIIEPARAPEVAPLIVEAYGLSPRERDVAQRVMLGHSTAEISAALHISAYTVQDHLKAVFDKVGVRSRGEMVTRIFERHYLPPGRAGHSAATA